MSFSEINYIGVVVGAILNMFLGFLWYGPLFAKPWMKLSGMTAEKIEAASSKMGVTYSFTFVLALLSAFVMQLVVRTFGIMTLQEAVILAVLLWSGFSGSAIFMNGLFVQKPFKLLLIDSGYFLTQMVMLAILYTFLV
jgi:hypothetical protein